MEKKPEPQQCIKGLCKAIEEYCKSVICPNRKSYDDVEGLLMIFFRQGGKARIHLIGRTSIPNVAEAYTQCLLMMQRQEIGEQVNYAT